MILGHLFLKNKNKKKNQWGLSGKQLQTLSNPRSSQKKLKDKFSQKST